MLSQCQTARRVFPVFSWAGIDIFRAQMGGNYNYLVRGWNLRQLFVINTAYLDLCDVRSGFLAIDIRSDKPMAKTNAEARTD